MFSPVADGLQTLSEDSPEGFEWVSVREAADRLGDTEKTIYNRTKPGHPRFLNSRVNEGKKEVLLPTVTEDIQKPSERVQNISKEVSTDSEYYKRRCEALESQVKNLQTDLQTARFEMLRMEGDAKRIPELERIIEAHEKTIRAQEMANEAMNNERRVINTQLQKYREDPPRHPAFSWIPWLK